MSYFKSRYDHYHQDHHHVPYHPLILLFEKVNGLHLPMTTMDAASLHHSMGYPTDPYLSGPPNRKQVCAPSLAFLRTPVSRSFPGA